MSLLKGLRRSLEATGYTGTFKGGTGGGAGGSGAAGGGVRGRAVAPCLDGGTGGAGAAGGGGRTGAPSTNGGAAFIFGVYGSLLGG